MLWSMVINLIFDKIYYAEDILFLLYLNLELE